MPFSEKEPTSYLTAHFSGWGQMENDFSATALQETQVIDQSINRTLFNIKALKELSGLIQLRMRKAL